MQKNIGCTKGTAEQKVSLDERDKQKIERERGRLKIPSQSLDNSAEESNVILIATEIQ